LSRSSHPTKKPKKEKLRGRMLVVYREVDHPRKGKGDPRSDTQASKKEGEKRAKRKNDPSKTKKEIVPYWEGESTSARGGPDHSVKKWFCGREKSDPKKQRPRRNNASLGKKSARREKLGRVKVEHTRQERIGREKRTKPSSRKGFSAAEREDTICRADVKKNENRGRHEPKS